MITEARINETVKAAGINFITALRAPAIHSLVEAGSIQLSLFDQRDLAEVSSPDYPDERLIVCRNPLLADERSRNGANYSMQPSRTCAKSKRGSGVPSGRCAAKKRSGSRWVQ